MTTTTINKMEDISRVSNVNVAAKGKAVKRKSPGPHFKNPLVNVYNTHFIHQDLLGEMASLYPVKLQESYNIMMTFKGEHRDIPVHVSQKELIVLYNIKMKDEDSPQEMSKEDKCDKMVHWIIDQIKNKYKTCIKQKCQKKVKTMHDEVVTSLDEFLSGSDEE
jgi:hypothetical protein